MGFSRIPVYLALLPTAVLSSTACTIVLPCYNPQPQWVERITGEYTRITAMLGVQVAMIVVNDGSTNVTENDIATLRDAIPAFQYVSYNINRGKGYALRQGVAVADTEIVIYTDIDFPYTTESVAAIYRTLNKDDFDVAAGIKNEQYYMQVPPARRYISKLLRGMIGVFFKVPVTDTQCGLKGFKKHVKQEFLDIDIDRYLFDLDFIKRVHKKRYKIKAVPVQLNEHVVFRRMSYKLLLPELINFIKITLR